MSALCMMCFTSSTKYTTTTIPLQSKPLDSIQYRWGELCSLQMYLKHELFISRHCTILQVPLFLVHETTRKVTRWHAWWRAVAQKHWILIVRLCVPFHDSSMFSGWLVAPQAYTIYTSCVLIIPRLKAALNKISVNAQSPFKSFNCL
mgnify:CR=1 FL=1